jgi:hypothetical protein
VRCAYPSSIFEPQSTIMRSLVVARAKPHQIVQIGPFQPPAIAQMMSVEVVSLFATTGCLAHPPSAPSHRSANRPPIRRVQIDIAVEPAAARTEESDYQDRKDKYHKHHNIILPLRSARHQTGPAILLLACRAKPGAGQPARQVGHAIQRNPGARSTST